MAEGFINLSEGSGKKAHAFDRVIGANTVLDEVTLNGEQYLASYTCTVDVLPTTANSHLLQLMAGASLNVRVRRMEVHQLAATTAANQMNLAIYRLTTAGTGGGVGSTPQKLDNGDAAAGAQMMTLPTVKGTEAAQMIWGSAPYVLQTITVTNGIVNPIITVEFDRPRSKSLIIPAGAANGIAVKNITAMAGTPTLRVILWIDESNFL